MQQTLKSVIEQCIHFSGLKKECFAKNKWSMPWFYTSCFTNISSNMELIK